MQKDNRTAFEQVKFEMINDANEEKPIELKKPKKGMCGQFNKKWICLNVGTSKG